MKKIIKLLPVILAATSATTITPFVTSCNKDTSVVMHDLLNYDYERTLPVFPKLVDETGAAVPLTTSQVSWGYYTSVTANPQILLDDLYSSIRAKKTTLAETYSRFECNFSNPKIAYDSQKGLLRIGFKAIYTCALKTDNIPYSYELTYTDMPLEFGIETVRPINVEKVFKLDFTQFPLYDSKWTLEGSESGEGVRRRISLSSSTAYETKDEDYVLQSSVLRFNLNANYMSAQLPVDNDQTTTMKCDTTIGDQTTVESLMPRTEGVENLLYGNNQPVKFNITNKIKDFPAGTYNMKVTARLIDCQQGSEATNEESALEMIYWDRDSNSYVKAENNQVDILVQPIILTSASKNLSFDFYEKETTNDEVIIPLVGIREPVSANVVHIHPRTWGKIALTLTITNSSTNETVGIFDTLALLRMVGTTPKI